MNENYDSLFEERETAADKTQGERLSPEEYAAKKDSERQAVYDLAEQTAATVIVGGDAFADYLTTLSRFELYSPTNTLLIHNQKPDATRLRDYDKWKESGTPVRGQQKGITIIEREDYQRDDGKVGYNYNLKKLFDISQTTAKPAEPPKPIVIKNLLQALMKASPCKINLVNELSGDGKGVTGAQYLPATKQIEIVKGMDGESIFRCLSQEIAIASLAQIDPEKLPCKSIDFTAYAASFTLCKKYGVTTQGFYDLSDVHNFFSDIEDKNIRSEIGAVRDTVADIAGSISKSLEQQKAARNADAR